MGVVPRERNKQAWKGYYYGGRSMRAVKDGLPIPSGEREESEGPRCTRADEVSSLVPPRECVMRVVESKNGYRLAEMPKFAVI
jgi:hypothetical protein